jgi:hypothetical protein
VSAGIAERKGMTFLIEPNSLTNTLGDYTTREVAIPVAREMTVS